MTATNTQIVEKASAQQLGEVLPCCICEAEAWDS